MHRLGILFLGNGDGDGDVDGDVEVVEKHEEKKDLTVKLYYSTTDPLREKEVPSLLLFSKTFRKSRRRS